MDHSSFFPPFFFLLKQGLHIYKMPLKSLLQPRLESKAISLPVLLLACPAQAN